jgi:hypothetical protein
MLAKLPPSQVAKPNNTTPDCIHIILFWLREMSLSPRTHSIVAMARSLCHPHPNPNPLPSMLALQGKSYPRILGAALLQVVCGWLNQEA